MSTERFIPARFKSIDLAEIEIAKLKHDAQNCEPRTPEVAVLSSKYLYHNRLSTGILWERNYRERI